MRISDWSADVCSSYLAAAAARRRDRGRLPLAARPPAGVEGGPRARARAVAAGAARGPGAAGRRMARRAGPRPDGGGRRQIGRAAWRERVGQYLEISVVGVSLKKKQTHILTKTK